MNSNNISKRHILLFIFITIVNCTLWANVKFSASLDSATLLMGNQTVVHIEILQDELQKGIIINEPKQQDSIIELVQGIEFSKIVIPEMLLPFCGLTGIAVPTVSYILTVIFVESIIGV